MDRLAGRLVRRFRGEPDEPTVAGLEGEDADQLFDALGSETSRAVLAACYEQGRTRSEVAEELETSIQNVGYHVDKLESAELLEAVETRYGENGREVTVYEPSKQAIVVAAGEPGFAERLADAVDRLFAPIALVGLIAMVVGVLARQPARIGMLGDDAASTTATTTTTATQPWFVAAAVTFVCGVLVVLAAARAGAFDHDTEDFAHRTGVQRRLFGRRVATSRRYAVLIAGFAFGTFLALDLVAVGAGRRLTLAAWIAVQLVIPAGVILAAALAYANDGLLASWGVASAPIVGIWGYLAGGDLVRGGFDPILLALGPLAVAVIAAPLGSLAYLAGRLVASRLDRGESLSRRTIALLVAHPFVVAAVLVGWATMGS
ncbi:ArsR family transcriptional regulator [Salinadaptatus halalkaliphilus]|uniref:ArsR family transcriptional regulator n=1 Tax=Salinadaptatus halalkaliphilus TaxID=2419781 RepID=A0A4S3TT09_9EURY|nr:helix-turn-helix domain-containing protein [Salinadaptatus halalkaliphilus]THE65778.1 ArsR family transcriptional regulator [Salinadaptatus halalkaliphilus]